MKTVKINNKDYIIPVLGFRQSRELEMYGVPLRRLIDIDLMLTIVSAFVAIITGKMPNEADHLIEQHVLSGGKIEDIFKAYFEAINDSEFFLKLIAKEHESDNEDAE